ncbi:MAG: shikimate dehydrogenase [Bacteroidia bacterium]|nr:shikimate dehydrogenase [Bacteroidia bacterium]
MRNFGVIGYPIGQTFSPAYFAKKFSELGINDACYNAFEVNDLKNVKDFTSKNRLSGFNVTIPHKLEIIKYLDWIDPVAAEINAVNVVKVSDGKLLGFNTDYFGFQESLIPLIQGKVTAMVFGSGGSSAAVKFALNQLKIDFEVVSRSISKGIPYDALNKKDIESNLLLINTTPLGMHTSLGECVDIPYHGITSRHLCYDLIYNPLETEFLRRCKSFGATIKNGLQMLELQADKSWDIWNS